MSAGERIGDAIFGLLQRLGELGPFDELWGGLGTDVEVPDRDPAGARPPGTDQPPNAA